MAEATVSLVRGLPSSKRTRGRGKVFGQPVV